MCGLAHGSNMPFLAASMTMCILKTTLIGEMACFAATVTDLPLCSVLPSHYHSAEHAAGSHPSRQNVVTRPMSYRYSDKRANNALQWSSIALIRNAAILSFGYGWHFTIHQTTDSNWLLTYDLSLRITLRLTLRLTDPLTDTPIR